MKVNLCADCYHNPLHGVSPESLLMRSCFSFSDGEGRIELESGREWIYYWDQLREYLEAFEIEYTSFHDECATDIADQMKDFGWSLHTPAYFFWIEDIKPTPEPRRIWK